MRYRNGYHIKEGTGHEVPEPIKEIVERRRRVGDTDTDTGQKVSNQVTCLVISVNLMVIDVHYSCSNFSRP